MPQPPQSPAFATIAPDDFGARLARLQDQIADAAGQHNKRGLITDYFEARAAGAMHSADDADVILLTLITGDGESHVYALDRAMADHLRGQMIELRVRPNFAAKAPKAEREPVAKPSGRLL